MKKMKTPHFNIQLQKPEERITFLLMFSLDSSFKDIDLQISRISNNDGFNEEGTYNPVYADIHFLLVTISNVRKLIIELNKKYITDSDFSRINKKYIPELERISQIRHHLEHITDGRFDGVGKGGEPLLDPKIFGILKDGEYNFGGEKIKIKDIMKLRKGLETDMRRWNKKTRVYPFYL